MRLSTILAFMKLYIKDTLRSPDAFFWTLIFPIILASLFIPIFAPTKQIVAHVKVGVVVLDSQTDQVQELLKALKEYKVANETAVTLLEYTDLAEAKKLVARGKIDALLVVPEKFTENLSKGVAELVVYINPSRDLSHIAKSYIETVAYYIFGQAVKETKTQVLISELYALSRGSLKVSPEELYKKIVTAREPIVVKTEEVSVRKVDTYMLRGFFVLSIVTIGTLFTGLYTGALAFVEEKDKNTLRRILAAPISPWDLLLGKTLGMLVVMLLSAAITIVYGVVAFKAKILFSFSLEWLITIVLILLSTLFAMSIGMIISLFAKTAKGAGGIAWSIGFITMFIAGITVPPWMLPPILQAFAYNFPLTDALLAMDSLIVLGVIPDNIAIRLIRLALAALIAYAIGSVLCRRRVEALITG